MKYVNEPQNHELSQSVFQGLSQEDTAMILDLIDWLRKWKAQSRTARRERRMREFRGT